MNVNGTNRRPLIAAGTLLGAGLGGFVDGIVFHQLLQLHAMLSARLPRDSLVNAEVNMFWDGVFHAGTWLLTATGLWLLWGSARRADVPPATTTLVGAAALGWGLFNLIEGTINHHLLHLHHVTEGEGHLIWDLMFLASGVVLIGVGVVAIRWDAAGRHPPRPGAS